MRVLLLLVACSGGTLTAAAPGPLTVCPGTTETIAVHTWNTDIGRLSLNGTVERTLRQNAVGDLAGLLALETYLPDINATQVDTITTDAVWTLTTSSRLANWFIGGAGGGGDTLSRRVLLPTAENLAFHNGGCGYSTVSVDPTYRPTTVDPSTLSPSILVRGVTVAPHGWAPGSPGFGTLTAIQVTHTLPGGASATAATLSEGVVSHAFDGQPYAGTWSIHPTYSGVLLDNCRHPPTDRSACVDASYLCTVPSYPNVPESELLVIDVSC